MSTSRSDRVIILKKIKHGESNLILHVLDSRGMRLNLIAKGALRSRKRFGGGILEPTHHVQITYHVSEKHNEESLHVLLEASLLHDFSGLRVHFERLELALYFLKLITKVTQLGQTESKALFDLLGNGLKAAEVSTQLDLLRTHFELKLLKQQGVLPSEVLGAEWSRTSLHQHGDPQVLPGDLNSVRLHLRSALREYLEI